MATSVPFRYTPYPATPTLSDDDVHVSEMLDCVPAATERLLGGEGLVESVVGGDGGGAVGAQSRVRAGNQIASARIDRLPAASTASSASE